MLFFSCFGTKHTKITYLVIKQLITLLLLKNVNKYLNQHKVDLKRPITEHLNSLF